MGRVCYPLMLHRASFGAGFLGAWSPWSVCWLRPSDWRYTPGSESRVGRPRRTVPRTRALRPQWRRRFCPPSEVCPGRTWKCWLRTTWVKCQSRRSGSSSSVRRRGRRPIDTCMQWRPAAFCLKWFLLIFLVCPGASGTRAYEARKWIRRPASSAASVRCASRYSTGAPPGLSRVFRGLLPGRFPMARGKAFDVARDKLVYRPDGESVVSGANSIAELPVYPGSENLRFGAQFGYLMPALTVL